jgi:hypothetical protein
VDSQTENSNRPCNFLKLRCSAKAEADHDSKAAWDTHVYDFSFANLDNNKKLNALSTTARMTHQRTLSEPDRKIGISEHGG